MKKLTLIALLTASQLLANDIYATFNVKAVKEATLAFTAGGTVSNIIVDVGDTVTKGAILASLENSEQKATLALAKSDLENAKISNQQSQSSYKRYKKIKKLIDAEKFEKIKYGASMTLTSLQKAKSSVALRQAQLEKTQLKAPFDGVITQKYKEVGDAVSGMQPVAFFKIMDMSTVKLIIEFDEKYFKKVTLGATFTYRVDGSDEDFTAAIAKIHPTINAKTRKIKAEVITKDLMPGLFGHGTIKVD